MTKSVLAFILAFPAVAHGAPVVDSLRTTGVGSSDQWTASAGNKYETVDENSPNGDTDYILTASDAQTQDFTVSDIVKCATIDSAWIKVNWTWTRGAGPAQDLDTYYDIGSGFTLFGTETTKSGTYVTDSVKLTSPTISQMNALQVRTISTGASGAEEWRVTWWGLHVYGDDGEGGAVVGTRRTKMMRGVR